MPIIIQETSVQVVSPQDGSPAEASPSAAARDPRSAVVPLRPADVERMKWYLNARRARLHAD
jgi:hypothetical protein